MLDIPFGPASRTCDGISRRHVLRLGGLGALGLSLADMDRAQAAGRAREINCILLWQGGGNSQLDTWDLKPDAPAEVRGEFRPIPTNVSGIRICELLPATARQMDKFAILRSVVHPDSGHLRACHKMLTGYFPAKAVGVGTPYNENPSLGAVIGHERPTPVSGLPDYVVLPKMIPQAHSAYLGARCNPYLIESDPAAPNFTVRDLQPPTGVGPRRLADRRGLLAALDRLARDRDDPGHPVTGMDTHYQRAYDMITSPATQKAFHLQAEPEKLRDAYGRTSLGQSTLLARRLVESGVRCVTIAFGGWDTHAKNFEALRTKLPEIDLAYGALLADLHDRGLLSTTLVVMMGEFGRTPKINKDAGRDHWPNVWSLAMAGGGIRGGQVIGESDSLSEAPAVRPIPAEDVHRTIYHQLGVDPEKHFLAGNGRPIQVLSGGEVIRELFT